MSGAMLPGAYAQALALHAKSLELHQRGHNARALEKAREALAAARSAGVSDCLMAAWLELEVAFGDFGRLVDELNALPACARFTDEARALVEVTLAVAATARRRRASAPPETATEQAWHLARVLRVCKIRGDSASTILRMKTGGVAPLAYDLTEYAATKALEFVSLVIFMARHLGAPSESELLTRVDAVCDLVDEAVALAETRRHDPRLPSRDEALKLNMESFTEDWTDSFASLASRVARVAAASQRLGGCLLFTADDFARFQQQSHAMELKRRALQFAASAPELLRGCAAAGCSATEAHASHFKSCAACKGVVYCCKEHQVAHWPSHKAACKAARKTAAEANN